MAAFEYDPTAGALRRRLATSLDYHPAARAGAYHSGRAWYLWGLWEGWETIELRAWSRVVTWLICLLWLVLLAIVVLSAVLAADRILDESTCS